MDRYRCPECESARIQFMFRDNLFVTYDCLECGTDFRKLRAWGWGVLFVFGIFGVTLLFHILSLIPLGVL